MTFDKAFEMLNLDTKNMGYWTLIQIALIRKVMSGLRKKYAKPVEIYEGDMVRIDGPIREGWICFVEWEGGQF